MTAVAEAFGKQNRRHALLVMATGSGKKPGPSSP
ncbi:hypothetical protein [Methanocorpusculum petauri]